MAAPKLLVNITLINGDKETEYRDLRLIMSDMGRWDILRSRKQWPKQEEAPALWMQVVSYFALIRTGEIPTETDIDTFLSTVISVDSDDDVEAAEFPAE